MWQGFTASGMAFFPPVDFSSREKIHVISVSVPSMSNVLLSFCQRTVMDFVYEDDRGCCPSDGRWETASQEK